MKQLIPVLVLAALAAGAANATAASVGVGAYGGTNIVVLQDDNKGGAIFGARVPVSLISFFTVEPYYSKASGGTKKDTFGDVEYSRTGFDVTTLGANVILGSPAGAGFKFFPYAGIGSNKLSRPGNTDSTYVGYNFGLGIGAGLTDKASIVFRGGVNMVKTGDTSRKFAEITGGIYYNLFKSK